jgi:hypothetical protein
MAFACLILVPGLFGQTKKSAAPAAAVVDLSPAEIFRQSAEQTVTVTALDAEGNAISIASGFFLVDGIVVTNLHAVKWASGVLVKPFGTDQRLTVTAVADFDINHDLCLLQVEESGHDGLDVEHPRYLAVGAPVYVIGNPKGLEGTFSKGMVTAFREAEHLIQIDAPISPGSSGGPVMSARGKVIGIATSSVVGGQNLNFATPVGLIFENMNVRGSYPVEMVGALAITDLEYEHLNGPVRSYLESRAKVYRNVAGPAVPYLKKAFDFSGRQVEAGYFSGGAPNGRAIYSFDPRGLLEKVVAFSEQGQQVYEMSIKPEERVGLSARHHSYSDSFGIFDEKNKELDHGKRNARGLETEIECPKDSEKRIISFDSDGRELETKVFVKGNLDSAYKYTYETDAYGNWTKKREYLWLAQYPESGFSLMRIYAREFQYFAK